MLLWLSIGFGVFVLQGNERSIVAKVLAIAPSSGESSRKLGDDFVVVAQVIQRLHLPWVIGKLPLLEFVVRDLQFRLNTFLDLSQRFAFLHADPQRIAEDGHRIVVRFAMTAVHHIFVRFQILFIFWHDFSSIGPVRLIQLLQRGLTVQYLSTQPSITGCDVTGVDHTLKIFEERISMTRKSELA